MRILFVDDEIKVLEGIERSLFHLDWEVETAVGGADALQLLEDEPVDVVVSDMRMPDMDGAALLERVKQLQPDALRIVLSGHTEVEAAMRAVPVAHQFLTKPCNPEVLQDVIRRADTLRALMNNENLQAIVGQISELPTLPEIYLKLKEVLRNPRAGVPEVSAVVEQDVAMSAKVLQLVNSSFFTHATKINGVSQAVGRLGINMVKSLALMTSAFRGPDDLDEQLKSFLVKQQNHALEVATIARSLCTTSTDADQAFLAGMLHDVGTVILECSLRDEMREVDALMEQKRLSLIDAELELLGATHAEVGGYLVGIWGLPMDIVEAIAFHHQPAVEFGRPSPVHLAVHLADALVLQYDFDEALLAGDSDLQGKVARAQAGLAG